MRRLLALVTACCGLGAPAFALERVGETAEVRIETPHPYPSGSRGRPVVWSHTITHPGATFVKLHFAAFAVRGAVGAASRRGDYVVLEDQAGEQRQVLSGTYATGLWASSIVGDTVRVELHADQDAVAYGLVIDGYGHGTVPFRPLSTCGADDKSPICGALASERIRLSDPVARLLFVSDCGGMYLCTGFLFAGDGRFMTNAHCVDSAEETRSVEVWFNYVDDATAAGPCSLSGRPDPDVFRAERYLGGACNLDVAVLQLADPIKGNPADVYGHLTLGARAPVEGEAIWVPQHPGGRQREIAERDAQVAVASVEGNDLCTDPPASCASPGVPTGAFTEFGHTADTDPGASGSPVLDASNQVIGLHHAGGCVPAGGTNAAVSMAAILEVVPTGPLFAVDRLLLTSPAPGRIVLEADSTLEPGMTLDPANEEVRLVLAEGGATVIDQTIPPGRFTANRSGTRWTFREGSSTLVGGLTKMIFTSRDGLNYRFSGRGRDLDTGAPADSTMDVTLFVGDDRLSAMRLSCRTFSGRKTCSP